MLFGVELFVDELEVARRAGDARGREGDRGAPHTGSYGERRRGAEPPAAVSSADAAVRSASIKNRQSWFLRRRGQHSRHCG